MPNVFNDFRSRNQRVSNIVIHDEVKESLSISLLLVLKSIILSWQLAQAGRQKNNFSCEDAELTIASFLGCSSPWEAYHADPVAAAQQFVGLLVPWYAGILLLAHDLKRNTLGFTNVKPQVIRRHPH